MSPHLLGVTLLPHKCFHNFKLLAYRSLLMLFGLHWSTSRFFWEIANNVFKKSVSYCLSLVRRNTSKTHPLVLEFCTFLTFRIDALWKGSFSFISSAPVHFVTSLVCWTGLPAPHRHSVPRPAAGPAAGSRLHPACRRLRPLCRLGPLNLVEEGPCSSSPPEVFEKYHECRILSNACSNTMITCSSFFTLLTWWALRKKLRTALASLRSVPFVVTFFSYTAGSDLLTLYRRQ